jgi:uncharacterized protein (DUF2336 family)
MLAFDDVPAVAVPVLALSERLDDATLIDNARTKSQQHLLAISHLIDATHDRLAPAAKPC